MGASSMKPSPEVSTATSSFSAKVTALPSVATGRRLMSEPSRTWRECVVQRLDELVRLDVGWDGYRGQPVSFENANFALRMLEVACPDGALAPQIVPGSDGDLQIEWHVDGVEIELDVRGPYDVYAWHLNRNVDAPGIELRLTNDFSVVARWIGELSGRSAFNASAAA